MTTIQIPAAASTIPTAAPVASTSAATATPTAAPAPAAAAATGTPTATATPGNPAPAAAAAPNPTASAFTPVNLQSMSFRQLQERLNKWTNALDLEERNFIEQATRGNSWDRTLMTNGDRITKINEGIKKVKDDHANMENAMDAVKANQRDLDHILDVLEDSLPANIIVEPEREHLYNMSVDINTQLQQMSEDLKEVIRHLNESNKALDRNDPVAHILKIMNEHTDTLQWMEDNASQVKQSLEDVSKMNQTFRRDHERSIRIMYKY